MRWADGRRFAWVDDEITTVDTDWVAQKPSSRSAAYLVSPRVGLIEEDFDRLRDLSA